MLESKSQLSWADEAVLWQFPITQHLPPKPSGFNITIALSPFPLSLTSQPSTPPHATPYQNLLKFRVWIFFRTKHFFTKIYARANFCWQKYFGTRNLFWPKYCWVTILLDQSFFGAILHFAVGTTLEVGTNLEVCTHYKAKKKHTPNLTSG